MARSDQSGAGTRSAQATATRPFSLDRRRFLEIGSAASLAAALPRTSDAPVRPGSAGDLPTSSPLQSGLRPHLVIYDERLEGARRFAVSVRSVPVPVHAIRGDVTQLWYSRLYPLWKREPAPIAGLTTYAAMFCLEQLAWERQLRMARCAAARAAYGSAAWPMERAAVIARDFRGVALADSRRGAAPEALEGAIDRGPLHFWLIATPAQLAALRT